MSNVSENLPPGEKHWSEEFSYSFQIFLISMEIIEWPILLISMIGMYYGIEIGHPVYSILFANLFVSFSSSTISILLFTFASLKRFFRLSFVGNVLCNIFHCSCWYKKQHFHRTSLVLIDCNLTSDAKCNYHLS